MGRYWYTAGEYRARVERLAARLPVFALGADVMVGFPSETEADFTETRNLLDALPFTHVHVFPYSPRPGTAALRLGVPVAPAVVRRRSAALRALVEAKARAHVVARLGAAADVVLLARRAGRYEGLTEDYLTLSLPVDAVPGARFAARLSEADGALTAVPLAA